jgi:hypothetical protein
MNPAKAAELYAARELTRPNVSKLALAGRLAGAIIELPVPPLERAAYLAESERDIAAMVRLGAVLGGGGKQ